METIEHVRKDCCGCGACANICPRHCIAMKADEEGFLYPKVIADACIQCGACENVCPTLHSKPETAADLDEVWAASVLDSDILRVSSSGGLFTALAVDFLKEGGCVFGAAFSEDQRTVRHVMVETMDGLSALRGSKYMQSETGGCYAAVRDQLKTGRRVLFTGTPCQTAGLKRFLGREDDNLLLVDVICHGAPSALLWQKYLEAEEKKADGKAVAVSFRSKKNGWKSFGMQIDFSNGFTSYRTISKDSYLQIFLKNASLRESCYRCTVKNKAGCISDITIGDFWGVEKVEPEIDNPMGVSLALVHTRNGMMHFERIKPALRAKKVDEETALRQNPVYRRSVDRPKNRNQIYKDLKLKDWDTIAKKYMEDSLKVKVRRTLSKSFLGRLIRASKSRIHAGIKAVMYVEKR